MSNRFIQPLCARWLLAASCGLLLFGCVSAQLTHLDPGFTPAALQEGALVIAGVTTAGAAENPPERQKASMTGHLEREIRERRPEVRVLPGAELASVLGAGDLDAILAEAGKDGINPGLLAPFADNGVRHVLAVVITYNAVDRFVTDHADVRNLHDADGEVAGRAVKFITTAQVKRSVTAEYRIFEVATGRKVWSSESSNARSRSRSAESSEGYPAAPDYAAVPTTSVVMRSMTTAAVKELPSPEKRPRQPVPPAVSGAASAGIPHR